jgi:hypothetical protein
VWRSDWPGIGYTGKHARKLEEPRLLLPGDQEVHLALLLVPNEVEVEGLVVPFSGIGR